MKKWTALLLPFLLFYSARSQDRTLFVTDSLDAYVKKALTDWSIPGVAVCIVKDGKILLQKGYGVARHGAAAPVDEHTLFMIGSNTKAFTATVMGMLQASGRAMLNDKVQKWLPGFALYDPWVAKEATLRDLLCHRLGFETFQGDFMYFDSDLSRQGVLERFAKVKPMHSFRSKWGYTNAAFAVAGEVIPKVTGRSWADGIRDSIFTPLGMSRSLAMSSEMGNAQNRAAAHTVVDSAVRIIPYGRLENMGPAGSISSSASDLGRWVTMLLNGGKYNEKQVVKAAVIREIWTPASIIGNGGAPFNRGHFSLYGLGWQLEEYSGRKVVSHTGGVNGFVTSVTLVPEEKLGIVVLTNTDANNFYESLKWEVMDAFLGLPYRNYSNVSLGFHRQHEKRQADWLKAKKDTIAQKLPPSLPIARFAGTYKHAVYGNMTLTLQGEKLVARFEHHKGRFAELEAVGGSRFLATFNEALFGVKVWPFTVQDGKVKSVEVTVADFVEYTPYQFEKIN